MDQAGFRVLPPLLPAFRQQFLGIGNIAYGRVEPDIEHLAFGPLDGNRHAPVEVAGDGTRHQAAVQPALALPIDIGLPLLVLLQDPFAEPGLVTVQREIPVLCLFLHRGRTAQFRTRVYELFRAEGGAALLTLVSIGPGIAALGASPLYKPVSEEHTDLLVVKLLGFLSDETVAVIEFAEELRGIFRVHFGRSTRINVEIDPQAAESVLHYLVVLVHNVLRTHALFPSLDRDGHSVLVAAADEQRVLSPQAKVADIDVPGDIGARKMADMDRTVGVRQGAGYKRSFMFHIYSFLILPSFTFILFIRLLSFPSSAIISSCRPMPAPESSLVRVSCLCWRRLT